MINKIVDGISKAINNEFGNNYEIYKQIFKNFNFNYFCYYYNRYIILCVCLYHT